MATVDSSSAIGDIYSTDFRTVFVQCDNVSVHQDSLIPSQKSQHPAAPLSNKEQNKEQDSY